MYLICNQNISVLNDYNKICTKTHITPNVTNTLVKQERKKLKHLKLLFCNKQKVSSKDGELDIKVRSVIELLE